jgi:hypothetical protein
MATIDASVAGIASNSYETLVEAEVYFANRLPLPGWEDAIDKNVQLIMATRLIDAIAMPYKQFIPAQGGVAAYYRIRRTWTGTPATTTQKLAWPRIGMYDGNGNAIPSNVIPPALKDAESELAGQLGMTDRTLDNEVIVQGITSIKAGSVALTFKDMIETRVIPDAVWNLMPPSWFTDEIIIPAMSAEFDVVSE